MGVTPALSMLLNRIKASSSCPPFPQASIALLKLETWKGNETKIWYNDVTTLLRPIEKYVWTIVGYY